MFLMLFLDHLPPNIRAQLTAKSFHHPRDMAAYADQIWDSTPPTGAACGGAAASAVLLIAGLYSLHAVSLPLGL